MKVIFKIVGRTGNAIFRYMASVILCIYYKGIYNIDDPIHIHDSNFNCSDELFLKIVENIKNNKIFNLNQDKIFMSHYYQHDYIYKTHKSQIIDFIKNNPEHYILTDGVNAGDKNYEKFYMIDILNTPSDFSKKYENVLHLRLEDFVTHNLYLKNERIIKLLNKNIISESLCIVCKQPTSEFEKLYIKQIKDYLDKKNIKTILEHNDVITDYYIMKEAKILICSKSTLSWCSAFFSTNIEKCYLPDYITSPNSTCKYPIDNTELY